MSTEIDVEAPECLDARIMDCQPKSGWKGGSRMVMIAMLALFSLLACADLYANVAREAESKLKIQLLENAMLVQLKTLKSELGQTLNDLVAQDQEISKMATLIEDLKEQTMELTQEKDELLASLVAVEKARKADLEELRAVHVSELEKRSMPSGVCENSRAQTKRDEPLWSASDKQSEIDRLNEELDNLEGELENAIIAKWNALEQLQSCQQGESVAEITPMPRKSAFEQNVLAAKAALANSDNSDDEPPFQPSDIEALNRETLEVDEAPDDSQLRQNSPAPMPQGPGHNPTENDFNAVAAS
eukprot:TRINITY_DN1100_c0_g3_i2.p1 TRINITY_DN1100_c0_g3~~TRINITY_DN1100_c0_g3_i2.p1  ORF type:complete len:325 (+),score=84.29 TRINITY_DN1100_c0_g3_i2:71-976(+)